MYDVGLKEAMKDIAAALGAVEDSRASRHQEVLRLNKEAVECSRDMVRIESQKVEMGFQFAAGIRSLSESLKEIADSIKK
ncbi:hypothetical protein GOP47_0026809 [Adiantum capillus-veneris]|nr:hypothetical protein GOP47_0026809 [Adiantum capillus-veneris]